MAFAGDPLLQMPPAGVEASLVVDPTHTTGVPVMALMTGNAFTVTVLEALPTQPLSTLVTE